MQMKIDSTRAPVIWESNASVAALKACVKDAPLTIRANQYGGFEQVGALGRALPTNDAQIKTKPGDIMLYSGNQLVVFYGSNVWSYTPLGRLALAPKELTALLSKRSVTITLERDEE